MRQEKSAPKAPINENITARKVRLIGADVSKLGWSMQMKPELS